MHEECVVAVYADVEQARKAVDALVSSNFPKDQFSLILSKLENYPDIEQDLEAGEDNVHDVMTGAGVGSLIGIAAGATLVLFGGTMFLVIGAFAGLLTGGVVGSLLGAMEGWGIHGHRIRHYENLVHSGHPLVVAHGDPKQVREAYQILQKTDATEVHQYATSDDDMSPTVG
ncbi:MAG TPA: hypothetical protein PLY87_23925 [Planctomycetaceae bacterium]|nr:hypothetical protein [Planctomycetaceae bacterium]